MMLGISDYHNSLNVSWWKYKEALNSNNLLKTECFYHTDSSALLLLLSRMQESSQTWLVEARTCYDWPARCGRYLIGLSTRWVESTYLWICLHVDARSVSKSTNAWGDLQMHRNRFTNVCSDLQMCAVIYKCTGTDSQINARQSCVCKIIKHL